MYLGRFQLGGTVALYLRCRDANHAPTLPVAPPMAKIFDGSGVVEAKLMPIYERYIKTGQFKLPLFLGRLYNTGRYVVTYNYILGTDTKAGSDCFDILPCGDARGHVHSSYFYERPEANYMVQGLEDGSITKGRNPTV